MSVKISHLVITSKNLALFHIPSSIQFDRNFEDFVDYYYRIDICKICPSGGFLHSAVNSGSKDVFSKHGFSNWKLHKLGSNWKLKKHARHNRFNHFWSSIFIFHLILLFFWAPTQWWKNYFLPSTLIRLSVFSSNYCFYTNCLYLPSLIQ